MAEKLGSAVLELRTDDAGYTGAIATAEARARGLTSELSRTATQANAAGRAVSGAADEAGQLAVQSGRASRAVAGTVPALRQQAAALDLAGKSARMAAMQQRLLLFQLNDIGVSLASGMNPLMVLVQQGSQIAQIYGPGEGGVGRAFRETGNMLTGLIRRAPVLTGAIALASAGIAGMTIEVNRAKAETVSLGDVALATWQVIADGLTSVLQPVVDAIAPWFIAAWDAVVAGAKWAGNLVINSFRAAFEDIKFLWANFPDIIAAAATGAVNFVIRAVNGMVGAGVAGINTLIRGINSAASSLGADNAAELFGFSGSIGEISFTPIGEFANPAAGRLAGAVQGRNARIADIMNDDPLGQFFDAVGDQAVKNARERKKKDKKDKDSPERAAPEDRSEEAFAAASAQLAQQILAARRGLATTIDARFALERQELAVAQAEARRAIADNDQYRDGQRAALLAQLEIKQSLEREALARREAEERAVDALAFAAAERGNQRDLLDRALRFARTRAERVEIEQQLLDLAYAQERAELEATVASQSASDTAKEIAAARLRVLDALQESDRAAVAEANEGPLAQYRREVGDVGANINDALGQVQVDGLEALNDGLVDAIMGARSLGDVFDEVADQIIAALLRIAIQQLIIKPILDALGSDGGGGLGSLFAGGFYTGGLIPAGQFGIVGERGPEPVISTPRGALVRPNRSLSSSEFRSAGPSISMPISINAPGADAAALERLRAEVGRLKAELPATIVGTMQDATDRRIYNSGGRR